LAVAENDVELSISRELFGEKVGGIRVSFGNVIYIHVCDKHGNVEHFDLDVLLLGQEDLVSAGFEWQAVGCGNRTRVALHSGKEKPAWCHTHVQDPWLVIRLLFSDIEGPGKALELEADVLHHLEEDLRALFCLLRIARVCSVCTGTLIGEKFVAFGVLPSLIVLLVTWQWLSYRLEKRLTCRRSCFSCRNSLLRSSK
jgi:hypothetical protein